mgnify:CR=1 FL=1
MAYVYIITNKNNSALYIGVTNNLVRRIYEHKTKTIPGFSAQYQLCKLVYYELYSSITQAIEREKLLKNRHRDWKINLITKQNPAWKDLYAAICF